MSDNVDYESLQSKTTSISTKKYILTLSPYISSFFSLLITILSLITIFTPFIQLQTFITGEGLSMNISSLYFIHDIYEINEITDTFALPINMVAGWTIFIIILLSLCLVLAIVTYIFSFKKKLDGILLTIATISILSFLSLFFYQKIYILGSAGVINSLSTSGIFCLIFAILFWIVALIFYLSSRFHQIRWRNYIIQSFVSIVGIALVITSFCFFASKVCELSYTFEDLSGMGYILKVTSIDVLYDYKEGVGKFLYYLSPLYMLFGFGLVFYFCHLLFQNKRPHILSFILPGIYGIISVINCALIIGIAQHLYHYLYDNQDLNNNLDFALSLDINPVIIVTVLNVIAIVIWFIWYYLSSLFKIYKNPYSKDALLDNKKE